MPSRRRWRKASDFPELPGRFDDFGDSYLDAVDSDLVSFGETGQRGFSDAWAESPQGFDDAAAAFATDENDIKGRDLDARSRTWKVVLVIVVALCVGGWFAYDQGLFVDEGAEVVEQDLVPALIAPDAQRTYDLEPTSVTLRVSARGDSLFLRSGGDPNPQPLVEPQEPLVPAFTAGPVIWAGRVHIALTGPGVADADVCLVTTLVADDLRIIDLAAIGTCPVENAVTGDRLACEGRQALLLEVWPFDPRSPTRPPKASAIRFRVEVAQADGSVLSQRGTVDLPPTEGDRLLSAATILGGTPGDVVTLNGQQCRLLDRSDLVLQLLPS